MENSERKPYKFNPKPEFEARMNSLLKLSAKNEKEEEKDKSEFWKIVHTQPNNSIRCNTLKISPVELKKRLEENHKWKLKQPFKSNPEVMVVESNLMPGELGRTKEHLLGYYYVQEISSMLPILSLKPTENDSFLDLCASPGSKTTQAAAAMKNKGNIIANDNKMARIAILASNLEKCGVSNTIITKRDGVYLAKRLNEIGFEVDKILVDAPCSGEGTLRSSPKTFIMWNEKMIQVFSGLQKALASSAFELLKEEGEMIYSTCTHAPEEDEEIIQFLLEKYENQIEILDAKKDLPKELKTREGITEWKNKKFSKDIKKCVRIYPQDNDTEGFFLCKIKKLKSNEEKALKDLGEDD